MRSVSMALMASLVAGSAAAQTFSEGPVAEWTVPWEKTRPRDPAVGPDGKIWFVGQVGNYVARLDPKSGTFERFEIDPGTHPHNVIVDPAGNAWYAGNRNGMIGKIDPRTKKITRYPMPDSAASDPHTMIFDRNGDIWFTVQNGNFVGKLTVASGKVELIAMATPGSRPYGIVIDGDNRPWFDLFGTNRIGTVDPKTMVPREYQLPNEKSRPRRIALTGDGKVWYGDYTGGTIGRLDPKTGAIREWPSPGGKGSLPYAMTSDDRGRLWMVETGIQPNRLVGFDSKTEKFLEPIAIPSGGGTVRYMVYDPRTKLIWFGSDANTIGRFDVSRVGTGTT